MVQIFGEVLTQDQVLEILHTLDPASTGLVSLEYLTSLATQHYNTRDVAERVVKSLDPRGRGVLTYKEFLLGVDTILRKRGGKRVMMGPAAGGQEPPQGATLPPTETHDRISSQCSSMSEGESYECYGEMDTDTSTPNNLQRGEGRDRSPNCNSPRRNTWQRTSLRRTHNNHDNLPNRKWGSFRSTRGGGGVGGELHRSSSFGSSGEGADRRGDSVPSDDVYSDGSLEEDVLQLNHKVQMLQQQMNALADNQTHSDERYTRAKQENATLQARVHMLEEQLREVEVRSEERLAEEERRHRELVARVDREKQLQVENCAIRLHTLELENSSLKDEAMRCRNQGERLRVEKEKLEEEVKERGIRIAALKDEVTLLRDQERKHREDALANQQLIEELTMEVERLRTEQNNTLEELNSRNSGISIATHEELQAQFSAIRDENKRLQEAHDEMQALLLTRSVEEGRNLLTGNNSLAAELEAMSQEELGEVAREELKIRSTLKEQQEVNAQLRAYIDGILLNIVENYPQLLEVKGNP